MTQLGGLQPSPPDSFAVKSNVSPISPHTLESCTTYIRDPFRRFVWVIPVRGNPPWDGTTSASVLANEPEFDAPDSTEHLPSAPGTNGCPDILWTHEALVSFWEFLQTVRTIQNHGPLGLSFYAVSLPNPAASSAEQQSYAGSHKLTTQSVSTGLIQAASPWSSASKGASPPLRAIDHFKIFHDARYTYAVRNILYLWSYRKGGQKIRLLKGAKLALVDELSRGILVC